jgi:hypothetical protein
MLVYFVAIWLIFRPFGTLYQEKSGNPDYHPLPSISRPYVNLPSEDDTTRPRRQGVVCFIEEFT